jgi:cytochrome c peroxidase
MITRTCASSLGLVAAATLAACSGGTGEGEGAVGEATADLTGQATLGKLLFDLPLPGTNGRSCATCHVEKDHFALLPARVAAELPLGLADPLFNAIDADFPQATPLTFNHLQAGLVHVTISLAQNLDVIDASGNVITNADRTVQVWRGVPSVANTAYTAPYQYDGRFATLPVQALEALIAHSQIDYDPPPPVLDLISDYESTVFSSPEAAAVGAAIAAGETPPDVDPPLPRGSDAAKGRALFQQGCAPCHGGPTGNRILDEAAHDILFPVINSDGSVTLAPPLPDGTVLPAAVRHDLASDHYLNIGITFGTFLGQVGVLPNYTGVDFPQYRIRFYTDATRTEKVVDLPPPPPLPGISLAPEAFSTDPGRALISGNPYDFESFKIPQLRGIKYTAPYFHDCSAPDLQTMVDFYSEFILPQIPAVHLPRVVPQPPGSPLPPESLTAAQKAQLIAYLETL